MYFLIESIPFHLLLDKRTGYCRLPNTLESPANLVFHLEYVFTTIQTQVQPFVSNKSVSDFFFLYLVPLFFLESIRTMFFYGTSKFLSGKEVCSQALGSRSLKHQASWSLLQPFSKERFFFTTFCSGTESFMAIQAI